MIRLFISEWDGRCDWLQTTAEHDVVWSIWAGDRGELPCAQLNGEWQFHAESHGLIGAFLACPADWAWGPTLLRDEGGLPLPGYRTIVSGLWKLFSRLPMLRSFQPLSGNSPNSLHASYGHFFLWESHLPVKFWWLPAGLRKAKWFKNVFLAP